MKITHLFRGWLILLLMSNQLFGQTEAVDQNRITRIEKELLPPIIYKGEKLENYSLQERMKYHRVKGVTIGLIDNYELQWVRHYGYADYENNVPISDSTLFNVCSISKIFTALAVLKEADDNNLKLTAPVNKYLKAWKLENDNFDQPTIEQVLSHSAGINKPEATPFDRGSVLPPLTELLNGDDSKSIPKVKVVSKPGEKFSYSGGGYAVLQQMLFEMNGEDFESLIKTNVLDPLGMRQSTFEQQLNEHQYNLLANGYAQNGNAVPGKGLVFTETAAAGLYSNATDLAKFIIEIQKAQQGKSNLLSSKLAKEMLTPHFSDNMGLGVFIDLKKDDTYFYHSGSNPGFDGLIIGNTQNGTGAVILTNSDNGTLKYEILRSIAKEYNWLNYLPENFITEVNPESLKQYTGSYIGIVPDDPEVMKVRISGNHLYADYYSTVELFPTTLKDTYTGAPFFKEMKFERDDKGNITGVQIKTLNDIFHGTRFD